MKPTKPKKSGLTQSEIEQIRRSALPDSCESCGKSEGLLIDITKGNPYSSSAISIFQCEDCIDDQSERYWTERWTNG